MTAQGRELVHSDIKPDNPPERAALVARQLRTKPATFPAYWGMAIGLQEEAEQDSAVRRHGLVQCNRDCDSLLPLARLREELVAIGRPTRTPQLNN